MSSPSLRPKLRRGDSRKSDSRSQESDGTSDSDQPEASTSSLPLQESVSTLQPPSPRTGRRKKRRPSKESSNASLSSANEGGSPPSSFLSRFISSFRTSSSQDLRPSLSRSLSTPGPQTTEPTTSTARQRSPDRPELHSSRFRPPFGRRGASDTAQSSRDVSPMHSPAQSPTSESSNPHESPASRLVTVADRSVSMTKRGSVASQRTVQQRSFPHATSPLASPTLPNSPSQTSSLDPMASASKPSTASQQVQNALAVLSELLPPALLLLAYIGPNHLFAPKLSAAINDAISATSPPSTSPYSTNGWDASSVVSSAASNTSLPGMLAGPSAAPSHTHELHAPNTLSLPAVTASALWKVLRSFEWLSKGDSDPGHASPSSSDPPADFDFPSLLQAAVDLLAAEAASRQIELLLGQQGATGSSSPVLRDMTTNVRLQENDQPQIETKELLVSADERQWMVIVSLLLRKVMLSAADGSTVEIKFGARQTSHGIMAGDNVPVAGDSQDTYVPTRASLRKHWMVMIDVETYDQTSSPPHSAAPTTPRHNGRFNFDDGVVYDVCSRVGMKSTPRHVDDANSAWRFEASLPGALLPPNESPSELLGKRRASLETANREPSMDDLKRFSESDLKGMKVALHAGEYSVFARHLTSYLAYWGMDVTYSQIDKDDDVQSNAGSQSGKETYWHKGRREPVSRLDSGFASSGIAEGQPYEPANSPLRSSASSDHGSVHENPNAGVIIIDDDIATLRRILFSLKPSVIHAAPLLAKRPQLATRRTRSSPHVRQIHHAPQTAPGWPIVHFASLSQYKSVREVIAETLAISKSGNVPDVIIVPKPAGPRRLITALWSALKKPAVDPALPPIATAPTAPGVQYWTPRLSPALSQSQDFDAAAAENLARSESSSSRAKTPPVASQPSFPSAPWPPSPLGQQDEQTSYFTDVAESMEGISPSEGMVVQSPDGKPAIFFQPQKTHRSSSSREKKNKKQKGGSDRDTRDDAPRRVERNDGAESPSSSHIVSAPHEIGLGLARRQSSSTASSPGEVSTIPLATPALSLDAFINFAKQPRSEPDASYDQSPAGMSRQDPSLSRHTSTSSAPSVHAVSAQSSRPGSERASKASSPRTSTFGQARRSTSGANSPPASPRVADGMPLSTGGTNSTSRGTSTNATPGARRKSKRKNSLLPTVPPINVLIVEDNPINQTILSMFMKKKGIKYAVAKDGEEAVQKWKNGDFHLVLMDIQLPVKDGITATREIRDLERQKNVGTFVTTPDSTTPASSASPSPGPMSPISPLLSMPVIIVALTASSLNEDRVTALAAGCNDFLTKPVSLPWLQQKLLEWGSMAYLSGFSKRLRTGSITTSSKPTPTAGFKASAAQQAQSISDHLHIDPARSHPKHLPTHAVDSPQPPGATGPSVVIKSPTPEVTPGAAQAAPKAKDLAEEAKHEAVAAQLQAEPDLDAVDDKLSSIKAQADDAAATPAAVKTPPRPPPVPLAPRDASARSSPEHQPSLESVLTEGSRLAQANKARSSDNSFGQVMTNSFPDESPE